MLARISTAALLMLSLAAGAQAQTAPSPTGTPAAEPSTSTTGPTVPSPTPTVQLNFYTPEAADMLASSLPGTRVYNLQNEEIGVIEDMLMDEGRTVRAFVIRTLARSSGQTASTNPSDSAGRAGGTGSTGTGAQTANPRSAGSTTGSTASEERLVAMAADSVIFARQPDGRMRPVVNTTAAGLRNAPEFKFEGRFARDKR